MTALRPQLVPRDLFGVALDALLHLLDGVVPDLPACMPEALVWATVEGCIGALRPPGQQAVLERIGALPPAVLARTPFAP